MYTQHHMAFIVDIPEPLMNDLRLIAHELMQEWESTTEALRWDYSHRLSVPIPYFFIEPLIGYAVEKAWGNRYADSTHHTGVLGKAAMVFRRHDYLLDQLVDVIASQGADLWQASVNVRFIDPCRIAVFEEGVIQHA